jgi:hypothetical protein
VKVRETRDKLDLWAAAGKVSAVPAADLGVKFPPQKFNSYREMNEWKADLLEQIARRGGVTWKK